MRLDIGCGAHLKTPLEDWTHLDGTPGPHIEIVCDWSEIPLPNGGVSEMHWGDVVEHIPCWELEKVLSEWNRVLKIGGAFHGSMPNVDRIMRDYADGKHPLQGALNGLYGWADSKWQQHYMTYTKETLTKMLGKYGFEVNDFSESPGPADRPWWLVFKGKKIAEANWRKYGC